MAPGGGRAPEGGSEEGIGGLGSLDDGGEEPRSDGDNGRGGKGLPVASWVERGGGMLQFGEGIFTLLLQGGWGEGPGAPLVIGSCVPSTGDGAMVAKFFPSEEAIRLALLWVQLP